MCGVIYMGKRKDEEMQRTDTESELADQAGQGVL